MSTVPLSCLVPPMGALSSLKDFFSRSEPLLAPMNDPFIQVDPAMMAERLKLRERGEQQGNANLPPADTATPDNVESEAISGIVEHYARAQIDTANSIRTYDRRLGELALLSQLSSIRTHAKRGVSDFKAEVANRLNKLSNSRDGVVNSYAELREFRSENHLRRPAHTVPPAVATIGTIALAWLFETLMNSLLLRLNDDMGYLGGVVAAATVGAINVLAAAFVGRNLWPQTNLPGARRIAAWTGIVLWVVALIAWNLLAAHFRDAKSLGLPAPERQAIHLMFSGLDSIYSWGLLAAGIIFAITAAMAGYKMDDPYPGYGEVARRHNMRCEDYAEEVRLASEELLDIRDEAIDGATSVRQELERQLAEHGQILTAREAFARRFEEFGIQLEQVGNTLLQIYRAANRAARSAPEPAHFGATWRLPRTPLPPPPSAGLKSQDIEAAEASLEQAVSEVIDAFDAGIERFEPLDILKQRLADG